MADASNISKLSQQILSQGISDKWKGEGFGSAKANAEDMAKILDGIGITDINQFGEVDVPADVTVTPSCEYDAVQGQEGEIIQTPRIVGYTGPDGKPVDASLVTQGTSYSGGENSDTVITYTAPLGTQKGYGNKETGQAVTNTYGERQVDNAWGGTYAGDGNTGYRVQFVDGKPIFYTTAASSNSLVNLIGDNKLLAIAANIGAAYFGGPAGVAALQAAQGKYIGDIVKAAVLTYAGGQISNAVSGSASVVDSLGQAGANIAGKAVGALATGRDPVTAAIGGGFGTMAGESVGLTGDLASTIGTSVVSGVAASFRNQDVTDAMVAGAVTGYLSNSKDVKGIAKASDEDLAAGLDPQFGSNGVYDGFMQGAMGPDAMSAIESGIADRANIGDGFDATENEGSLTKTVNDGGFLSTVGDAASKVFTGMSGADAVKTGVVVGLTTNTDKSNDLNITGSGNTSTSTTTTSDLNDDIYKDAPIKGYHMKQNAEGRYIPYIGDRALLAKGGFVTRRN
jgi:hypothetical protein